MEGEPITLKDKLRPNNRLKKTTSTVNGANFKSFLPKINTPKVKIDLFCSRKFSIAGYPRLSHLEPLPPLKKNGKTDRFCESPILNSESDDDPSDKELHVFINQMERRRVRDKY